MKSPEAAQRSAEPALHGSPLDSELELLPTHVGAYTILREIGRGLTAVVYEARGPDGVACALKLLRATWSESRRGVARFRTEADILAKVEHPNVIAITSALGLEADVPYFTMELAEGSLCDLLEESTRNGASSAQRVERIVPLECARMLALVARAVDFAYQRGILHRDLKPANILRVPGRELVVADFGIALDLNLDGSRQESIVGCGTPGYFAPELARGEPATCASDIYSLGVILYELLVGRLPIPVSLNPAYYGEHVQSTFVIPPRRFDPTIPRELAAICLKALEKRPDDRYQTAAQLAEDLELVRAGYKPRYAALPSLARAGRDFARRSPLLAVVFVAALLMAGSAALLAFAYANATREAAQLEQQAMAATARVYAGAITSQFEMDAERARRIATDPRTLEVFRQHRSGLGVGSYLEPWVHDRDSFSTVSLLTPLGEPMAQQPERGVGYYDMQFGWREYISRAQRLADLQQDTAVSLVRDFRSYSDQELKMAFIATVFDAEHNYLGLVLATRKASQTYGNVIRRSERDGHRVVLLAPRDRENAASPLPNHDELSIVVHPGIHPDKDEHKLDARHRAPFADMLDCQRDLSDEQLVLSPEDKLVEFADYHDPVPGYGKYQLAVAVPVGCTGYAVMLEQRADRVPLKLVFASTGFYGAGILHACMVMLSILATILTIRAYRRHQI